MKQTRMAVFAVALFALCSTASADENLTVPELAAAIEEAHRAHLKVAIHAIDTHSIQTAIDAGADSIEHGNEATDAQLKQMRDKGIFLDLTQSHAHFLRRLAQAF